MALGKFILHFIDTYINRCRTIKPTVVFADANDEHVLQAARELTDRQLAVPILLGQPTQIREWGERWKIRTNGIKVMHPLHDAAFDINARLLQKIMSAKGLTLFDARQILSHPLWYAAMMVAGQSVDMAFAGNRSGVPLLLKIALNVIGGQSGNKNVFGVILLFEPQGERVFAFADGVVMPRPSADQLADMAVRTTGTYEWLTGNQARTAFLSFSTDGSAYHELTDKVQKAVQITRAKAPQLLVDGELQFDAALVPEVAEKKAPASALHGDANVFIFPSLNAANIGYKIARHLAGWHGAGPFIMGLKRPFHLIPPGSSSTDIIHSIALAAGMDRTKFDFG
ncbi:MAG: phosphate acetyltransferase [Caldithrix sp.]|nr:phosphate acetyltransferase [Caldithrix sp.]